MNKIFKIILIIVILAIISVGGFLIYSSLQQKNEISKLPAYYQDLAKKCIEEPVKIEYMGEVSFSSDCCMASLRAMAAKNGQLIEGDVNSCPDGFQLDMLRCPGSYKWCEPIK